MKVFQFGEFNKAYCKKVDKKAESPCVYFSFPIHVHVLRY